MHLCNDPPQVVPTWKEPNVTHMNVALVTGRWTLLVYTFSIHNNQILVRMDL